MDADLSRRVFLLMAVVEERLAASAGRLRCSLHLEMALLAYCHNFRCSYIGEQHGMPELAMTLDAGALSAKHRVYLAMFERMGLGDHTVVVNKIITKIGTNLKYWASDEGVVGQTLTLFHDIASGYSSSKLLLSLGTVNFLLEHHTEEYFEFLSIPGNTRHRTTFYGTLSKLLFTSMDDQGARFDTFMAPLVQRLASLAAVSEAEFRQESVQRAIIGLCRDLRGVVESTHSRQTYGSVFELLYGSLDERAPTFRALLRALEVWPLVPEVTTSVLKFMLEFVYNKNQRVVFHQSSPNGILLFRETSALIVAFGSKIIVHQPVRR
jgi:exportin-7